MIVAFYFFPVTEFVKERNRFTKPMNMKHFNLLFFLLFLAATSFAQEAKVSEQSFIPRELLMQDADIFQVKISKDGSRVYSVSYTHLTLPTNREV